MTKATQSQLVEWQAAVEWYQEEGPSGVAAMLEEMLEAVMDAEDRAENAEGRADYAEYCLNEVLDN